jgi:hypothetical protein
MPRNPTMSRPAIVARRLADGVAEGVPLGGTDPVGLAEAGRGKLDGPLRFAQAATRTVTAVASAIRRNLRRERPVVTPRF